MWGLAFLIDLVMDIVAFLVPFVRHTGLGNLTWLFMVPALAFTVWYPGYARKRTIWDPDTPVFRVETFLVRSLFGSKLFWCHLRID
ncbi:MAG: hypothetical protein WC342_04630 [Methanoregula sp.]